MPLLKDDKEKIKKEYKLHDKDTGSVELQIALLTERIKHITGHLKQFPKDHNSRRSLLIMVGRRRRFLNYINRRDTAAYQSLLDKLGLRK